MDMAKFQTLWHPASTQSVEKVCLCVCMHKLEQRALQDKCVFLCGESRGPVHTASLPTSSCANQAKTERFFLQGNKQSAHSVPAGEP